MTPILLDFARKAGFTLCRQEPVLSEMLAEFAKLIIEHEASKQPDDWIASPQPADELLRLRDLLGKANALARIRANEIESLKASLYGLYELEKQRDELQERLIKTEDQLGEAVWNYGELKREQLANQQKTSGSPIDSLTEPADEPVGLIESLKDAKPCCGQYETCWRACTPRGKFLGQRDAKREWVGLDRKEMLTIIDQQQANTSTGLPMFYRDQCMDIARAIEAKLKEKNI